MQLVAPEYVDADDVFEVDVYAWSDVSPWAPFGDIRQNEFIGLFLAWDEGNMTLPWSPLEISEHVDPAPDLLAEGWSANFPLEWWHEPIWMNSTFWDGNAFWVVEKLVVIGGGNLSGRMQSHGCAIITTPIPRYIGSIPFYVWPWADCGLTNLGMGVHADCRRDPDQCAGLRCNGIGLPANVTILRRGDCNCDGTIDFADVDPFVYALSGQQTGDCPLMNADCNRDGRVSFADVDAFVGMMGE